jgi:hypothetical protein
MCDKRTFNRELDLESGQWEEAIRRDERQKVLSEVEKLKDKKFPRGERRWCVECGQRIYKELLNQLKESFGKTEQLKGGV